MRSAFDEAVWVPGQPLDPGADQMQNKELTDRLLFLEKALSDLQVGDLPMGALEKTLEQNWLPDAATLFAGGAIGNDSLEFSIFYAQVNGTTGGITLASDSKLSVARASAGNYVFTYPAFKVVPIISVLPQAVVTGLRYANKTVSSVNILMSADSDFDILVVGK